MFALEEPPSAPDLVPLACECSVCTKAEPPARPEAQLCLSEERCACFVVLATALLPAEHCCVEPRRASWLLMICVEENTFAAAAAEELVPTDSLCFFLPTATPSKKNPVFCLERWFAPTGLRFAEPCGRIEAGPCRASAWVGTPEKAV